MIECAFSSDLLEGIKTRWQNVSDPQFSLLNIYTNSILAIFERIRLR
tara:strand:+ start:4630 stop:4770 length:141 start_codon:yes stop_codon:yes gene_type:complete